MPDKKGLALPALRVTVAFVLVATAAAGIAADLSKVQVAVAATVGAFAALSALSVMKPDARSIVLVAAAAASVAVAAFGFLAPWAVCAAWPSSSQAICPPDRDDSGHLQRLQRHRLGWAAGLALLTVVLLVLPREMHSPTYVFRVLRADLERLFATGA